MDTQEAVERYPHEIITIKRVTAGMNGYGRKVTWINKIDVLFNRCAVCGVEDLEEFEDNNCKPHQWEPTRKTIDRKISYD